MISKFRDRNLTTHLIDV